jgi:hypothetical protein
MALQIGIVALVEEALVEEETVALLPLRPSRGNRAMHPWVKLSWVQTVLEWTF